jgi:hypothetical protein
MADSILDINPITSMWLWEPDWSDNVISNARLSKALIQYGGSPGSLWIDNYEVPKCIKMKFVAHNKIDESELLNFFEDRNGRFEKFWIPAWTTHFTLDTTIESSDTGIIVRNDKFASTYRGYERLIIILNNGDILVRKITAVTENANTETLTISSALGVQVLATDIAFFGLFLLMRFDSDKIVLEYTTDSVSETTLQFYELIREYP